MCWRDGELSKLNALLSRWVPIHSLSGGGGDGIDIVMACFVIAHLNSLRGKHTQHFPHS